MKFEPVGRCERGITEFSIAAVGRDCETAGCLRTQSIRNAAGKDYRDIINSLKSEAGAGSEGFDRKARRLSPPAMHIEPVPDIQVRVRLSEMLETAWRLRGCGIDTSLEPIQALVLELSKALLLECSSVVEQRVYTASVGSSILPTPTSLTAQAVRQSASASVHVAVHVLI